jgi:hypothetical protein
MLRSCYLFVENRPSPLQTMPHSGYLSPPLKAIAFAETQTPNAIANSKPQIIISLLSSIIYTFKLMSDYLTLFKDWIVNLGEEHNVDPLVLGGLYLTSKVLLFSFLAWTIKCFRAKKPILAPLIAAATGFSLPYIYLVIAGRNLSIWVYVLIGAIFILGAFSIWKKITAKEKPVAVSAGS